MLWLLWGKLRSLVKTGHQCKWDKGVERVAAAGSPARLEGPGSSSLSQGKLCYEAINSIPRLRLTTVSVLPAPDHSSEGKGLHTHIEVYDNVYMKILRKWTSVIGRHITSVPKCSLS